MSQEKASVGDGSKPVLSYLLYTFTFRPHGWLQWLREFSEDVSSVFCFLFLSVLGIQPRALCVVGICCFTELPLELVPFLFIVC